MQKSTAIMELVAGYDTFATAADLEITAAMDAPATSPACVWSAATAAARVSSAKCGAWVGSAVVSAASATVDRGC
ncbi:LxmA leader domain family RiPP [Kitasatospora purpeofusca]|uniref:LxmA leader domain family RiPP n=1 Tax=Kitasatospora purpeofusca TaxID=67352 RepID=UPI00364D1D43